MFFRTADFNIKEVLDPKTKAGMTKIASILGQKSTDAAKKVLADIEPNFLYFITSGIHGDEANQNGDYFPWEELLMMKQSGRNKGRRMWETWIGCPSCLNHDINVRVGEIIDTWPIKEEKSIDMLHRIDEKRAGSVATGLRNGSINGTSMGVMVGHSYCSVCRNRANNEDEWCDHLHPRKLNLKGKLYTGQDGNKFPEKIGQLVYEENRDLEGVEDSIITLGEPADPKALLKQVLASKENEEMITNPRSAEVRAGISDGIVRRDDSISGEAKQLAVVGSGSLATTPKIDISALYRKRGLVKAGEGTSVALPIYENCTDVLTAIKKGHLKKIDAIQYCDKFKLVTSEQLEDITPSMALEILASGAENENLQKPENLEQLVMGQSATPVKNKDIPKTDGAGDKALSLNDAKPEDKGDPAGSVNPKSYFPSSDKIGDQAISSGDAKPGDRPDPDGSVSPEDMRPIEPSTQADEVNKSKPGERPDPKKISGQSATPVKNSDFPAHKDSGLALSLNDAKPEDSKPAPKGKVNPESYIPTKNKGNEAADTNKSKPGEQPDPKKAARNAQADGLMDELAGGIGDGGMGNPPHEAPSHDGLPKNGPEKHKVVEEVEHALELLADMKEIFDNLDNRLNKKVKKPKGGEDKEEKGEDKPSEKKEEKGEDKPSEKKEDKPEPKKDEGPKSDGMPPFMAAYKVELIEDAKSPVDSYYLISHNNAPVLQITAKHGGYEKELEKFKSEDYRKELTSVLNAKGCREVFEKIYGKRGIVLAQAMPLPDSKAPAPVADSMPQAKPMSASPEALDSLMNQDKSNVNLDKAIIGTLATIMASNKALTTEDVRSYLQDLGSSSDKLSTLIGQLQQEVDHMSEDKNVSEAPPVTPPAAPSPAGQTQGGPLDMDTNKLAMLASKVKALLPEFKRVADENTQLKNKLALIEKDNALKARVSKTLAIANKKVELGLLNENEVRAESVRLAKLPDADYEAELRLLENSIKIAGKINKSSDYTKVEGNGNVKNASLGQVLASVPNPVGSDEGSNNKVTYAWSIGPK